MGFVFTGPLNENSGFRFGVKKYENDGFIKNQYLQTDETNNIDELVSRFKIYMDSDNQLLEVNFLYSDIDNGYDAFSLDNTRITLSDKPGHDRQETFAGSLKYLMIALFLGNPLNALNNANPPSSKSFLISFLFPPSCSALANLLLASVNNPFTNFL